MITRMLVIRGVRTTDELEMLGLPMAHRYASADKVALVGSDGRGLMVKGSKETTVVEFHDADSTAGRCMRAVRRVKEAFNDCGPDDLSEAAVVGMFLYYWPVASSSVSVVIDAIEQGDVEAVEQAGEAFIATDFGANLAALGTLPGYGSSDAGGHAADGASSNVPPSGR